MLTNKVKNRGCGDFKEISKQPNPITLFDFGRELNSEILEVINDPIDDHEVTDVKKLQADIWC